MCMGGSIDLWVSVRSLCYLWDHFLQFIQTRRKTNSVTGVLHGQIFNMVTFHKTAWTMVSVELTKETYTSKNGLTCTKSLSFYFCLKLGLMFIVLGKMLTYQWFLSALIL